MTFEEIRDMINSTITPNGNGEITGAALNAALNEMVTAMSEFKPTGGTYLLSVSQPQTEEEKAACKAIYDEIYPMLMAGTIPTIYIDMSKLQGLSGGVYALAAYGVIAGEELIGILGMELPLTAIVLASLEGGIIALMDDGTIFMGG